MKKTKLILFTLVASMMLMGAGYAYWTDTLEIENTVSTGNLDLEISSLGSGDYDNTISSDPFGKEDSSLITGGFENGNQDVKSLEFSTKNLYPGSGFWLKFQIKNTGTVPVKLKNIKPLIGKDNKNIRDDFRYTIGSVALFEIQSQGEWDSSNFIKEIHSPETKDNGITKDEFSEFVNRLENKLKFDSKGDPIILMPGESLLVGEGNALRGGYDIYLREDSGNNSQNSNFDFTLQFNFTQHNDTAN